ncbi:L-aspartate oxidase [Evansella sp. AB-P1]|uniref:L-aspartate oxidase n=1 Tax=Evansella sp. AB-P1 TaxID=3037653 RepID=UPI0024200411|nr:L-aspartate oxidase [Evansella sp. AB-P1]MDG5786367.1 L-aspartate oxidase [Evansella sp. AB-P1]
MATDRDVIIVGSGMAALVAAMKLINEKNVKIFTKEPRTGGNSWRAQGGMAAAIHQEDSPFQHLQDTLEAGCFHNDPDMVSILVNEGLSRVKNWLKQGMTFDHHNGELSLGMEGAHRNRRILHAGGDQTGYKCMEFLHRQLKDHPNIQIFENEMVFDLIIGEGQCQGVLSKNHNGTIVEHRGGHTILATGGCGGLFEATTNDTAIIGDGLAMAYRAGAALSDLEFMQFHPTLIKYKGRVVGLASEALRGEGAILVDETGRKIMENVHLLKDLAPRDVVARVIERETHAGKQIFLDISAIVNFEKRFPTIYRLCKNAHIPLEKGLIPITTGAHFLMGGIVTDSNGRTTIPNLYAVGEAARTGVHGANRLASNSLLEALVFGERIGEFICKEPNMPTNYARKENQKLKKLLKNTVKLPSKGEIQYFVSRSLGVVRNEQNLSKLIQWLEKWDIQSHFKIDRTLWRKEELEISNMMIIAFLMGKSALERTESRGAHYRTDYSLPLQEWDRKQITLQKKERVASNQ